MLSNLGQSTIPDLMKIYDLMAQRNTQGASSLPQERDTGVRVPVNAQHQCHQNTLISDVATTPSSTKIHDIVNPRYHHPQTLENHYQPMQYPHSTSHNTAHQQHVTAPEFYPSNTAFKTFQDSPSSAVLISQSEDRKRPIDTDKKVNRGNDSNKSRKKKDGDHDGRWSRRFAWPDELHRHFVSAVFDVGLKHSSPSSLLEQMPKDEQTTSERIKSHLQKYRLHRQKSKEDFISSYDAAMTGMKNGTLTQDQSSMNWGEVAAHLSHKCIVGEQSEETHEHNSPRLNGSPLYLPQLTEDEKRTPLGASMGLLVGLFLSLNQQLDLQRKNSDPTVVASSIPSQLCMPHNHQLPCTASHFSNNALPQQHLINQPHETSSQAVAIENNHKQGYTNHDSATQLQSLAPVPVKTIIPTDPLSRIQQVHCQQQDQHSSWSKATLSHPSDKQNTYINQQCNHISTVATLSDNVSKVSDDKSQPNSRNNAPIKENHMMKREMQSQMVFQNKMRKLKENEIEKHRVASTLQSSSDHSKEKCSIIPPKTDCNDSSYDNKNSIGQDNIPTVPVINGMKNDRAAFLEKKNHDKDSSAITEDFWQGINIDDNLFQFLITE